MPDLKNLVGRYRYNKQVYLLLWCIIALGIVPAIITQNISPLDSFNQQFGVEIVEIVYLPWIVCLLILVLAVAACVVQRRYWLILLLLPWLALIFYDVDELVFQMPTYSKAQDRLQNNYNLVKESATAPTIGEIRTRLEQIVYKDDELLDFEKDDVTKELSDIEAGLQNPDPQIASRAKSISSQIAKYSEKIDKAKAQIKKIEEAMDSVRVVSRFSFGLSDNYIKIALGNSLDKVTEYRDNLISQRNVARATLEGINNSLTLAGLDYPRIRELYAEVKAYLWISNSHKTWSLSLIYKSICFAVLLLLIWKFNLGSWIYLLTAITSLAVAVLYVDAPLSFRLWVVVKFVIISLIIRALYLLFIENFPLIRKQSRAFLLQTFKTTLIYYLPFIFLIGLGAVISAQISATIEDGLYQIDPMDNSDKDRDTLRKDIDKAIDVYFAVKEDAAHNRLDNLSVDTTVDKVAEETMLIFDETVEKTLPDISEEFEPPTCSNLFHWVFTTGNCVQKEIKEPLNISYEEVRFDQRKVLERSTMNYAKKAGTDAQKAILIAKEDLSENLLAIKLTLKKQLSHIYSGIDLYTWVSLLILIIFTLKSFMYVFARIFFANDDDGKRVIQFETVAQPEQQGVVKDISDTLELSADMGELMYVNKDYDFANAPPDEVTPQGHKAFFSRFKNGVWHMNKIKTVGSDDKADVPYLRIPDDERIVAWRLKPGDAVVFSWKTFVGMSDSISIRSQYSWQLSSLVFGRMFFVVASVDADSPVDGTLLLVARGSDGIRESINPSNSPDQLLAWQTTTRFQLHASLTFRNVYRSGVQIKARDSDLAVMHLSDKKRKSGAASFMKYFLAPI